MRANGHDRRAREELLDGILAVNGFNAIKTQILTAAGAAGPIPLEAYEAALRYMDQSIRRLEVDLDPRAKQALDQARYERAVMDATLRFRKQLAELDDRQRARQAITAG